MQHAVQALILHTGLLLRRHDAIPSFWDPEHLLRVTLPNPESFSLIAAGFRLRRLLL